MHPEQFFNLGQSTHITRDKMKLHKFLTTISFSSESVPGDGSRWMHLILAGKYWLEKCFIFWVRKKNRSMNHALCLYTHARTHSNFSLSEHHAIYRHTFVLIRGWIEIQSIRNANMLITYREEKKLQSHEKIIIRLVCTLSIWEWSEERKKNHK